jgi:ornithine cyclodeaminase/alanine dehydrogenase-like protein (mu-crystallin family)
MKKINRRAFLVKTAWAAGAGALAAGLRAPAWAAPVGANDAVRLGIIGCGAKAQAHIKQLMLRTDVRVVALCDVDPTQIAKAQAVLKPGTAAPFTTPDARALLARADVDAVLVVTPSDDVLSSARIRVGAVWFGWRCDLHEVMVGVIAAGASYSSSGLQAQQ